MTSRRLRQMLIWPSRASQWIKPEGLGQPAIGDRRPTEGRPQEARRRPWGVVPDYRGETLKGFIRVNVARGSHIWTDDNKSYYGLDGYGHTPRAVGKMAAHVIMPWIHRVFSNAKRWGLGVFHGFREKYWNRRHSYRSAFDRLVGIGVAVAPATRADIMAVAA